MAFMKVWPVLQFLTPNFNQIQLWLCCSFHLTFMGSKYLLVMFAVWNKLNNFHGTVCMGCSCLVQIGAD